MSWILVAGVSFLFVFFMMKPGMAWLTRLNAFDIPTPRSSHQKPVLRGGGIVLILGIFAGFLTAGILGFPIPGSTFFGAVVLLTAVGFLEDLRKTPILLRLFVHILTAWIVLKTAGPLTHFPLPSPLNFSLGPFAVIFTLLWMVGIVNLYNFLDGIDGFAVIQTIIIGSAFICLPPLPVKVLGLVLAAAGLGFLRYNWHPARVFLGDSGSTVLGFLVAAAPFFVAGGERQRFSFYIILLLLFFGSDGTFTLLKRLFLGQKIWQPHRMHLYQRLVICGYRHDQVVSGLGAGMLLLVCLTLLAEYSGKLFFDWLALGSAVIFFCFYFGLVKSVESLNRKKNV